VLLTSLSSRTKAPPRRPQDTRDKEQAEQAVAEQRRQKVDDIPTRTAPQKVADAGQDVEVRDAAGAFRRGDRVVDEIRGAKVETGPAKPETSWAMNRNTGGG